MTRILSSILFEFTSGRVVVSYLIFYIISSLYLQLSRRPRGDVFGFVTDRNETDNIEFDHDSKPQAGIVERLSSAFRQSSMIILYDIVIYAVDGLRPTRNIVILYSRT